MTIVVKIHIPKFDGDMPKDWKPHMPTRFKGTFFHTLGDWKEQKTWSWLAGRVYEYKVELVDVPNLTPQQLLDRIQQDMDKLCDDGWSLNVHHLGDCLSITAAKSDVLRPTTAKHKNV